MIPWLNHKRPPHDLAAIMLVNSADINQMSNYGPAVQALEDFLRQELEVDDDRAVIATVNGTAAMHAIINALKIHHQIQSIATTAFTFPSNIEGPMQDAVVFDVDDDLNIDATPQTDCLVATNLFGMVQRHPSKYVEWTVNHDAYLVFDNAATPFSFIDDNSIVNFGDGCIISLHHTKQIGFGEGGVAIVRKEYEQTVRSLINFGIPTGHQSFGFNGKMTCLSAAYIHAYLIENLLAIKEHHIALHNHYKDIFGGFNTLPDIGEDSVPFCFPIFVDNADEVIANLKDRGIDARKYYRPLITVAPHAWKMFHRIVCLPCNLEVSLNNVNEIGHFIKQVAR